LVEKNAITVISIKMFSRNPAHFESACLHNPDIRREPVPELDLDDVPEGELLRLDVELLALPEAEGVLRHHVGKGFHDLGGLGLLVVGKYA